MGNAFYGPAENQLIKLAVGRGWISYPATRQQLWQRISIETGHLFSPDDPAEPAAAEALRIIHAIDLMMLGL